MESLELTLRPHQRKTNDLVFAHWKAGRRKVLAVAPTGSGKRYQGVWLAKKTEEQGKRCLLVMDRKILVRQMYEELEKFGVNYGIIMGDIPQNREAPVQVASLHTLRSRYLESGIGMPPADLVIIDEAHKELDAYSKLLTYYPDALALGLTATPVCPKGFSIVTPKLYDAMVEPITNSQLIRQGFLLPVRMKAPSEPDIQGVRINDGEYSQSQLAKKVWDVTTIANILEEWEPFTDRKTIVFAPGVSFCRGLKRDFEFWGYGAEVIHAETKEDDREEIFARFNDPADPLRVLISVDVLREGFDAPIASCVIDLQPNNQLRTVWQKWGRAKRAYQGQEEWVLIDMAGNWWRHIHPDDDPDWMGVSDKVSTKDIKKKMPKEKEPRCCPKCKAVWVGGLKCTACGFEIKENERVRFVRQGNGKLKEIIDKEKAPPSEWEKVLKTFQGCLYGGARGRKTLNQVRWDFERKTGKRMPDDLPGLPPRGDLAWEYPSTATYPESDIGKIIRKAIWEHQQRRMP